MDLSPIDHPVVFFVLALVVLSVAAQLGLYHRRRRGKMGDDEREELNLVLTSSLTLLALIIGFSFSMAVGRYDQRKSYEAAEANAIETEYLRVGMLNAPYATRARDLLKQYVDERVATYKSSSNEVLLEHRSSSKSIQSEIWLVIESAAVARPDSIKALIAQGMNDVIDTQGLSAAAWANRIPLEAWILMFAIAICCCGLIGFDTKQSAGALSGYLVLPILISISFFLIADLDSTQAGLIRVSPDNLISTAQSMRE